MLKRVFRNLFKCQHPVLGRPFLQRSDASTLATSSACGPWQVFDGAASQYSAPLCSLKDPRGRRRRQEKRETPSSAAAQRAQQRTHQTQVKRSSPMSQTPTVLFRGQHRRPTAELIVWRSEPQWPLILSRQQQILSATACCYDHMFPHQCTCLQ